MKYLYRSLAVLVTLACFIISCKKEDKVPAPTAQFSVQAANLAVTFKNESTNARYFSWNFGDNSAPSDQMSPAHFYEEEGTYNVTLTVTGRDGSTTTFSKQVTVVAPPNLVQGGKMNAGDESKWKVLTINTNNGVTVAFTDGKAIFSGGNWGHAAIYQAIEVKANQKYAFSMLVSGSGATNTWLEVYFGRVEPIQNKDYSSEGIQIGLNTWAGCGNNPFNGNISTIGCKGALVGKNGEVTFSQGGTIYLLIKTGGQNLGTGGIALDNISLTEL